MIQHTGKNVGECVYGVCACSEWETVHFVNLSSIKLEKIFRIGRITIGFTLPAFNVGHHISRTRGSSSISQSDITLTYTATTSGTAYVVADIERWKGEPNSDPTNPEYFFQFDATQIYKVYSFPFTAGTHTIDTFTNIFTSVLDQPKIGFYRYFYNLGLGSTATVIADFQFTTCEVNVRTMSTQVVKA